MTEQEAMNNPELKTILLLSGYASDLGDGKDFEKTTYQLAKTLVKVFYADRAVEVEAFIKWHNRYNVLDYPIPTILADRYLEFLNNKS